MSDPRFDEIGALLAEQSHQRANTACVELLASDPENADAWRLAAQVSIAVGDIDEAAERLMTARLLRPDDTSAFDSTQREIEAAMLTRDAGNLLARGRLEDARALYLKTAELCPDRPWPLNNLGNLHMEAGRLDEAIDHFRRAAAISGSVSIAQSNLLMAMIHSDRAAPEAILNEQRAWAARIEAPPSDAPPALVHPRPDRPIRIGYVSPDFRDHPVANFMLPVLAHHDVNAFRITCYDDSPVQDQVSRRLQSFGHNWVPTLAMSMRELLQQIRAEGIDILIDLAVHSARNRMPVFAARAAPIQMTWLGYAGSTACPAVDFRITDAIVDPPGMTEHHFTERLLRLPDIFWCFAPTHEATPPDTRPQGAGPTRIGAATRLAKISPTCLDLWSALLRAAPEVRMVLAAGALRDDATRREWIERFADRGIAEDRIELLTGGRHEDYLRLLGGLDLLLDTFPFNGGTTACQSLWMGTPVVALAGRTSVSRVTTSILSCIGLPDLVAESPDQWVQINLSLLANEPRRRELRATLRQRMLDSPLCDGGHFTRNLEAALRAVFTQACDASARAS